MRTPVAVALAAASLLAAAPASAVSNFVVTGRGYGHGVGMSQYGAQGFALHGWGYRRILAHYYPGTHLDRVPDLLVRVLIASRRPRAVVSSKQPFRLGDAAGRRWKLPARRLVLTPAARVRLHDKRIHLRLPVVIQPGAAALGLDGSGYRGSLNVVRDGSGLAFVNVVSLDLYARGVVPSEMPYRWARAALEAQAVAARSYAVSLAGSRTAYDVRADTRDQVYGGIRAETPRTNRAVSRTAREVLRFGGAVARTYYSSTSGGRTQGIPGVPYLRSVADPYDTISPHHRWGPLRYSGTRLGRLLHLPAPTAVHVARNGFGRATSVYMRWHGGGGKLDASAFQKRLGLFSTWFWVGKAGKVGASHRAAAARARATRRSRRSEAARPRQRRRHRPA